jgi:hypothetical protein
MRWRTAWTVASAVVGSSSHAWATRRCIGATAPGSVVAIRFTSAWRNAGVSSTVSSSRAMNPVSVASDRSRTRVAAPRPIRARTRVGTTSHNDSDISTSRSSLPRCGRISDAMRAWSTTFGALEAAHRVDREMPTEDVDAVCPPAGHQRDPVGRSEQVGAEHGGDLVVDEEQVGRPHDHVGAMEGPALRQRGEALSGREDQAGRCRTNPSRCSPSRPATGWDLVEIVDDQRARTLDDGEGLVPALRWWHLRFAQGAPRRPPPHRSRRVVELHRRGR